MKRSRLENIKDWMFDQFGKVEWMSLLPPIRSIREGSATVLGTLAMVIVLAAVYQCLFPQSKFLELAGDQLVQTRIAFELLGFQSFLAASLLILTGLHIFSIVASRCFEFALYTIIIAVGVELGRGLFGILASDANWAVTTLALGVAVLVVYLFTMQLWLLAWVFRSENGSTRAGDAIKQVTWRGRLSVCSFLTVISVGVYMPQLLGWGNLS